MKITQINGSRGIILKSSIKKVIIDSDVENASAFKDVVITHLSLDTLNIIQRNSNQYRRINLSYDLMLLLQKLWRNQIIPYPDVMPKFRILPTGYPTTLGLEFKITAFDSDDGLTGSTAILIEDMNTGEKLGYVPNFVTNGQHKNRIKKWKREFRDAKLTQFISFNTNINSDTKSKAQIAAKEISKLLAEFISNNDEQIQNWLKPFNPERMKEINSIAFEKDKRIVWQASNAKFLHYFYPDEKIYCLADDTINSKNLVQLPVEDIDENDITEKNKFIPLDTQIENYSTIFKHSLSRSDFSEIIKIIEAKETYMI